MISGKLISLFEELSYSNNHRDVMYDLSEIVDYFLNEHDPNNIKKTSEKVSLLYCSLWLILAQDEKDVEHQALAYFLMGRILIILGIPIYAHQYLKRSLQLSNEINLYEFSPVIEKHINEVIRRYKIKYEQGLEFKDKNFNFQHIELNQFNEIYSEASEYLENEIVHNFVLIGKYDLAMNLLENIIDVINRNASENRSMLLIDKMINIISNLMENKEYDSAIAFTIKANSVVAYMKNNKDIADAKIKNLIRKYAFPWWTTDVFTVVSDSSFYLEELSNISESLHVLPKKIKRNSIEIYVGLSVIYSITLISELCKKEFEDKALIYHVEYENICSISINVLYRSINNCLSVNNFGIAKLVESPDDCYCDISQALDDIINKVRFESIFKKDLESNNFLKMLVVISNVGKASSYLSRAIAAYNVAQEAGKSMASAAQRDEYIAKKICVEDCQSAIIYSDKILSDLLRFFKLDIEKISYLIDLISVTDSLQMSKLNVKKKADIYVWNKGDDLEGFLDSFREEMILREKEDRAKLLHCSSQGKLVLFDHDIFFNMLDIVLKNTDFRSAEYQSFNKKIDDLISPLRSENKNQIMNFFIKQSP